MAEKPLDEDEPRLFIILKRIIKCFPTKAGRADRKINGPKRYLKGSNFEDLHMGVIRADPLWSLWRRNLYLG